MQINSSSIYAHNLWVGSSANNIANANTDGYNARDTRISEDGANGVSATTQETQSSVNLTDEVPEQIAIERSVEANAQAIRTHDETLGTTINIKV
ncbi:MAG: flagellar basal body rod C-terminal domain-containing protein [Wolinella sp.]